MDNLFNRQNRSMVLKHALTSRFLLTLVMQLLTLVAFAQVNYYKQIKEIATNSITAKQLFFKLDSLKQTRRPADSYVKITFDRDIDFGYKHQRIDLQLNGAFYHLNLLVKTDTILMKRVLYGNSLFMNSELEQFNKNNIEFQVDANKLTTFLTLRNKYYGSKKNIDSLKTDLNLYLEYSSGCGDGNLKPPVWLYMESLVRKRDVKTLKNWLNSISCERQAFAVNGFKLLKKAGCRITANISAIKNHIEKRNSVLVRCEGCFVRVR